MRSPCVFCGLAWYLPEVGEWLVTAATPPDCKHETIMGEAR